MSPEKMSEDARKRERNKRNRRRYVHCINPRNVLYTRCNRPVSRVIAISPEVFKLDDTDSCKICIILSNGKYKRKIHETGNYSRVIHCLDWRNKVRTLCGQKVVIVPWRLKGDSDISCKMCQMMLDRRADE